MYQSTLTLLNSLRSAVSALTTESAPQHHCQLISRENKSFSILDSSPPPPASSMEPIMTTAFALPRLSLHTCSSVQTAHANPARVVVEEGRKQARRLMYGAGGAFRGLEERRKKLERLMMMTSTSISSGFGGGFGSNGFRGNGRGRGLPDDNSDADDDDSIVDPSWGIAPSAHVLLRSKADAAYGAAVANLMSMSVAFKTNASFVDPSVPVVVLLGWMGARQKHLAKYKKFYEGLGYEVHCVFNNLYTAIFPPASKAQAKRIERFIDGQPMDRPVIVHAFSIGTGIYGFLLDSLRHEKEKFDMFRERVAGVIFDSGPAPIFPNDVAKGLNTVFPMISRKVWEPIATTFFQVTRARQVFSRSEDALRKIQFPVPQLYFYCGNDKVIPNLQHAVEDFVEKNKQRGVEVYKTFWEKSIHASHFKVHPEEYIGNLSTFLNRCMEVYSEKKAQVAAHVPH